MQIIFGERITAGPSFGPAVCFRVLHVHIFLASPTRPRTHIAAGRRPKSVQSARSGMLQHLKSCAGFLGSVVQWHCWCGSSFRAQKERHSRLSFPRFRPPLSWLPPAASLPCAKNSLRSVVPFIIRLRAHMCTGGFEHPQVLIPTMRFTPSSPILGATGRN